MTLPIAWVVAIVVTVGSFGITQALSLAAMRSDVRDILTRMAYESQIKERDLKLFESRISGLEAKIESAGLRNFNMQIAQELSKAKPR